MYSDFLLWAESFHNLMWLPLIAGLWWILLLRAYGKCSGDLSVQERIDVQTGIKMILKLCLSDGFDMFPTLLVTDGSCMIDRRMGIHGHPLEIQVILYYLKQRAFVSLYDNQSVIESMFLESHELCTCLLIIMKPVPLNW